MTSKSRRFSSSVAKYPMAPSARLSTASNSRRWSRSSAFASRNSTASPSAFADARASAEAEGLAVEFRQANALDLDDRREFDAVLSLADGAIGYFPTEEQNLRLFDVVAAALRPGGKHVLAVCSADHARKHFPKRHWEAGARRLSLADFRWNERESRMRYRGHSFRYGEPLPAIPDSFPEDGQPGTRLYSLAELEAILGARGLEVLDSYGGYDVTVPASPDRLMQVVVSRKRRG